MKKYREINLEENAQSLDEALQIVKYEIKMAKENKVGCFMFIHGYGSSGVGGIIRVKVRQWLVSQAKKNVIKNVINGESFSIFTSGVPNLINTYKELSKYLEKGNEGITFVEI